MAVSSVELIINAAKAVTALRQVDKEGRKVQQVMGRAQGALYNLGEVGRRATKRLQGGFKGAAREATELNASLSGLRGGFARLGGAVAAKEIIETGVSAIESERKIKLLTSATGDTAEALAIAERAATKFGLSQTEANIGVARLLARLKPMGMSLETIEQTFVGFNTAARLAGATASESAGAFLQLTQALGSGVLRGQELNSILEQAPLIAQAIAEELGVTVGALKKLGEEGKILSPVVISALTKVGEQGAGQLAEALKGPGQQFRNLRNAAIAFSDTATQKLLPAILPVVNAATELLKGFVALPEPVKAIIVGTTALTLAFAALPPAILLAKGALVALKVAILAFPFVAAAAGLVAIGVAAAEANKRIKAFNDVVAITGNTTKELDKEAEEVQKEIDKLAVKLKRGGHEGRIAREKLDKLNEALDKIETRKDLVIKLKIDVPFPDFDKMGPGFREELNRLLGVETEAQKKARLRREKEGRKTVADMIQGGQRDLAILKQKTQLGKDLKELEFRRADALDKINKAEGVSQKKREEAIAVTNKAFDAEKGSIIGEALAQDIKATLDLKKAQEDALLPLQEEAELLEAKLAGNEQEVQLKQQVDDIMRSTKGLNRDDVEAQVKKVQGLKDQVTEAEKLEQLYARIGQTIETEIVDSLLQAKSASEALSNVLNMVANELMRFALGSFNLGGDKGSGSGIFGAIADIFRANGGPVKGGRSYIVGERGPEVFTPGVSGGITPNHAMGGANVTVNVDASGSSVEGNADQASQLGKAIGIAVQQELVKQKRPGGLLAS